MNRFSGTVVCCDIDGTLIDSNLKLPKSNLHAIKALREEGGLFTVATGRTYVGADLYLKAVKPDMPIVCQNGSAVYDCCTKKYLWCLPLPEASYEVVDFVRKQFPAVGVEIMTNTDEYCLYESSATRKHESDEFFKFKKATLEEIKGDRLKVVFADAPPVIDEVQSLLESSPYYLKYKMARSYPTYYEYVNTRTNKAEAVKRLSEITKIALDKFVVVGDNDNDCEMLSLPCRSYVPSTASANARACADFVLDSSNDDGILPELLERIQSDTKACASGV